MNIPELIDQIRLESEEELNKFLKGLNKEKIIQLIIDPKDGKMFGLSSNGTVYIRMNYNGEWDIYSKSIANNNQT